MDPSVRLQTRNYSLALHLATAPIADVNFAADALALDAMRTRATFLRWNGVGDLTEGAVRVLNACLKRHPTLVHWVTTRKFDLARTIRDHPALFLMPSLDGTETPERGKQYRKLLKAFGKATIHVAWVRRKNNPLAPPPETFVVFNEHTMAHRSGDDTDPRTCPATVPGGLEHEGACTKCRRCFT